MIGEMIFFPVILCCWSNRILVVAESIPIPAKPSWQRQKWYTSVLTPSGEPFMKPFMAGG